MQLEVQAGVTDVSELIQAEEDMKKFTAEQVRVCAAAYMCMRHHAALPVVGTTHSLLSLSGAVLPTVCTTTQEAKKKGKGAGGAKAQESAEPKKPGFVAPEGATSTQIAILKAQWEARNIAAKLKGADGAGGGAGAGAGAGGGGLLQPPTSQAGVARARSIANKLAQQLSLGLAGAGGLGAATNAPEPEKKHFELELEINDYPQQARWKVRGSEHWCVLYHNQCVTET